MTDYLWMQVLTKPDAALAVTAVVVVIASYLLYTQQSKVKHEVKGKERPLNEDAGKVVAVSKKREKLKNILDVARKSRNSSNVEQKKEYEDKPFGSSYYYAHNNPNTTGGYKDGLKTEDYIMNGPRLLSKGGMTVNDPRLDGGFAESEVEQVVETKVSRSNTKALAHDPSVKNITKYMWDDPGDHDRGIATIRINELPTDQLSTIPWQDAAVTKVEAELFGEGLVVKIETKDQKYQLKIRKLYGDAASVNAIQKPKKLLLKICKKKSSVLSNQEASNLDAWPRPHRTI